jgi:hypothetical protein
LLSVAAAELVLVRCLAMLFPTLFLVCICFVGTGTRCLAIDTVRTPAALQREGITLGGGDGSSFEKAIVIHAPDEVRAIVAEHEYILLRYRLLQLISQVRVRYHGKHYDIVTYYEDCELRPTPNWKKRLFYFDMSNYYGKRPQASNKALQPTATRCASTFIMIKTVQEIISLAPGSRG